MHRSNHLFRLATLVAAVALAACGDSTAPRVDVSGQWILRAIDGVRVDAPPPAGVDVYIRVSEQLTLNPGGNFEDAVKNEYIQVAGGNVLDTVNDTLRGTWSYTGSTLHLVHDGLDELGGLIGDTLRVGTSAYTR